MKDFGKIIFFTDSELNVIIETCEWLKNSVYKVDVQYEMRIFLFNLIEKKLTTQKVQKFISVLKQQYLPKEVVETMGIDSIGEMLDSTINILSDKI